jgi:hypothetical protein
MKNIKETIRTIIKEESEYQQFFRKALEKAGKSITDMSDEEKKAFFNKIDAAWDGKGEKNEGNAFGAAVTKAKEEGDDEFTVGGKTYPVKESVNESFEDPLEGLPQQYKDLLKKLQRSNVPSVRSKLIDKMNVIRKGLKLKPLTNDYKESVNESLITEDLSTAFVILMSAASLAGATMGHIAAVGGVDDFTPIKDLKAWWQKRKSDKVLKSIINKIKDDEDVVKFMKLTPAQQRGKFRSLIATKLSDTELDYLNKINRSHFKKESVNEGKFKVDDLVYNKKTKTVGIVRIGDDKYGEVKTDADGNVNVTDLEKYNPIKFKHQSKAKVAPSTEKEVNSRGLFNPFKNESINENKSDGWRTLLRAERFFSDKFDPSPRYLPFTKLHKIFKGKFDSKKFREVLKNEYEKIGDSSFINTRQKNYIRDFAGELRLNASKYLGGNVIENVKFYDDVTEEAAKLYKVYVWSLKNPAEAKALYENEVNSRGLFNPFKNESINEYDEWKNTRTQSKNIFRMLKQKYNNNISKMRDGLEDILKQNKTKNDQAEVVRDEFNKFFKIKTESVNENFSNDDIAKIKGAVESASSFMGIGSELKKLGMKYDFSTSPLPVYMIKKGSKTFVLVNKKYAEKPDFVVGTTAGGLLEGKLNENKIDWADFYKMAKDTSGYNPNFEKKYGKIMDRPHVADAIKTAKDFKSFMRFIQKFESVINEGNAFGMAVTKAKQEGKKEFEFNGKIYKVKKGSYEKNEAAKKLAEKKK